MNSKGIEDFIRLINYFSHEQVNLLSAFFSSVAVRHKAPRREIENEIPPYPEFFFHFLKLDGADEVPPE